MTPTVNFRMVIVMTEFWNAGWGPSRCEYKEKESNAQKAAEESQRLRVIPLLATSRSPQSKNSGDEQADAGDEWRYVFSSELVGQLAEETVGVFFTLHSQWPYLRALGEIH
jgi:hypothetical protein